MLKAKHILPSFLIFLMFAPLEIKADFWNRLVRIESPLEQADFVPNVLYSNFQQITVKKVWTSTSLFSLRCTQTVHFRLLSTTKRLILSLWW